MNIKFENKNYNFDEKLNILIANILQSSPTKS
jgi:hypothetical protein